VFLNLVEYYEGILFVTTNREEAFDKAFRNRMHAIVKFPKLDITARHHIWTNLLVNRPNPVPLDESWSKKKEELTMLAKLDLNGRDIRNFIRTAWAFASSDKKKLGIRNIVAVLNEICKKENLYDLREIEAELGPALLQRVLSLTVPDADQSLNAVDDHSDVEEGGSDDGLQEPEKLIGGLHIKW